MSPTRVLLAVGVLIALSACLSFLHPWGDVRSVADGGALLDGATAPAEINQLLGTKCADCHSNRTHWPLYSRFAPASWLIERDVSKGRTHFNMSAWGKYDLDLRIDLLAQIALASRKNEMPVKQYLWLHPAARLTGDERQRLALWAKSEAKRLRSISPQP